jgi:2-dehydro-3-deoxyphosphogluconate aldolase/(4S)-4-hydroxy-2-oxoglutarate aldolase
MALELMPRPAIPAELEATRVVAIMRRTAAAAAVQTAEALLAGGLRCIEVTCDSPGAFEMIAAIRTAFGQRIQLGAGTVLDMTSAETAIASGASFLVSPHTDPELVNWACQRGVPFIAGALSPTEILTAWRAGAPLVKLFPAGSVGADYVKDIRGPMREIPLLLTGGITLENASGFFSAGAWGIGIGSALVDSGLVARGEFAEIERRAREFIHLALTRSTGGPAPA